MYKSEIIHKFSKVQGVFTKSPKPRSGSVLFLRFRPWAGFDPARIVSWVGTQAVSLHTGWWCGGCGRRRRARQRARRWAQAAAARVRVRSPRTSGGGTARTGAHGCERRRLQAEVRRRCEASRQEEIGSGFERQREASSCAAASPAMVAMGGGGGGCRGAQVQRPCAERAGGDAAAFGRRGGVRCRSC